MKHTAKAIKQPRTTHELTQVDLAKILKTTPAFVSLIENEKSKLPLYMGKRLLKKYDGYFRASLRYGMHADAQDEIDRGLGVTK